MTQVLQPILPWFHLIAGRCLTRLHTNRNKKSVVIRTLKDCTSVIFPASFLPLLGRMVHRYGKEDAPQGHLLNHLAVGQERKSLNQWTAWRRILICQAFQRSS